MRTPWTLSILRSNSASDLSTLSQRWCLPNLCQETCNNHRVPPWAWRNKRAKNTRNLLSYPRLLKIIKRVKQNPLLRIAVTRVSSAVALIMKSRQPIKMMLLIVMSCISYLLLILAMAVRKKPKWSRMVVSLTVMSSPLIDKYVITKPQIQKFWSLRKH